MFHDAMNRTLSHRYDAQFLAMFVFKYLRISQIEDTHSRPASHSKRLGRLLLLLLTPK